MELSLEDRMCSILKKSSNCSLTNNYRLLDCYVVGTSGTENLEAQYAHSFLRSPERELDHAEIKFRLLKSGPIRLPKNGRFGFKCGPRD